MLALAKNSIFAEEDRLDFIPDDSEFQSKADREQEAEAEDPEADEEDGEEAELGGAVRGPSSTARAWTVRRCAVYVLERLSKLFGGQVFYFLKGQLDSVLGGSGSGGSGGGGDGRTTDWLEKECMVLILGAIAEHSHKQLAPDAASLVEFLFAFLAHEEPLLRATTLWTLSRFVDFLEWSGGAAGGAGVGEEGPLERLLEVSVRAMLDAHLFVQAAACKCVSTIIEFGIVASAHAESILARLSVALGRERNRSLLALLDILSQVCNSKTFELKLSWNMKEIKDQILKLWSATEPEQCTYPAFVECVESLIFRVPRLLEEHVPLILAKSMRSVQRECARHTHGLAAGRDRDRDRDRSLIFLNFDCLSALAVTYGRLFEEHALAANLAQLLREILHTREPQLLQFLFALIGDLSQHAPAVVEPHFEAFVDTICEHISLTALTATDPLQTHFSLCNNACWSVGQLSLSFPKRMAPAVPGLMRKITELLNQKQVGRRPRE